MHVFNGTKLILEIIFGNYSFSCNICGIFFCSNNMRCIKIRNNKSHTNFSAFDLLRVSKKLPQVKAQKLGPYGWSSKAVSFI